MGELTTKSPREFQGERVRAHLLGKQYFSQWGIMV